MSEQLPTFWMTGYLPNGVKVSFTCPVGIGESPYEIALAFSNGLLRDGFLLTEPGLEAGEEKAQIVTVMRREKSSDSTPIIDMYPAWGAGGDEPFGTYKYLHVYLNTQEDIAAFLTAAGLKSLEQIPLYDGQAPLKRTANKRHAKEFTIPTPFFAVRKQGKEKIGSDGNPYRPWELVRYEPATLQPSTDGLAGKLGAGDNRRLSAQTNGATPLDKLLKDCWGDFYRAVDPLFSHTKHRQNFMEKHIAAGDIKPDAMTGVQVFNLIKTHLEQQGAA